MSENEVFTCLAPVNGAGFDCYCLLKGLLSYGYSGTLETTGPAISFPL